MDTVSWYQINLGVGNAIYREIKGLRMRQRALMPESKEPFRIGIHRVSGGSHMFFPPDSARLAALLGAAPCEPPGAEYLMLPPLPWGAADK